MVPSILVVDDEPGICDLLIDILSAANYTVRTASSGRTALAAVAAETPDIVLSDVFMPEMDGWTLAAELRRRYPTVQIVMMSAFHQTFPVAHLRFVPKPFSVTDLLTMLDEALAESSTEQ